MLNIEPADHVKKAFSAFERLRQKIKRLTGVSACKAFHQRRHKESIVNHQELRKAQELKLASHPLVQVGCLETQTCGPPTL